MKTKLPSMCQVAVKQSMPDAIMAKIHSTIEKVQERAYELFRARGQEHGNEIDDWLSAERELGILPAPTVESAEDRVRIRFEPVKFDAEQVEVYAEPTLITVSGRAEETDGAERVLLARFVLPEEIDTNSATAAVKHGALEIEARKHGAPTPVSSKSRTSAA